MIDGVPLPVLTTSLVFLATIFFYTSIWIIPKRSLPYPPGPKPRFLVGNAFDMPKTDAYRVFADWGKQSNSDIVHATAFGKHFVIINSLKVAEDLFERRAKLYSDRVKRAVSKTIGFEHAVGSLPYGDSWRLHRKMCQESFRPAAAKQYQGIQTEVVHELLHSLLIDPEQFEAHSKLASVSITLRMMYAYIPSSLTDPLIHTVEQSMHLAALLLGMSAGGSPLMTLIPMLWRVPAWVPGAKVQRMAKRCLELVRESRKVPEEHVRKTIKEGTATTSFLGDILQRDVSPEEEFVANNVAWTTYGAASETTISATASFFHLLAKDPHVQRRAQAEIDRVIGAEGRLPNFTDRERTLPDVSGKQRKAMPYVEAVYREVMRCCPPLPLGIMHSLVEDDIYEGYFLPKGSMVIGNIYGMCHDERVYKDPEAFRPERFLNADGGLNEDSRILAYGFGRRVCAGKAVASSTMWLIIVSVLASFDIGKAKDEDGKELEINDEYVTTGVSLSKVPFKCSITPRSESVRKLIDATKYSR